MIQFLVHEKADNVGVATVDIKAGETAQGLFMDSQESPRDEYAARYPAGTQNRPHRYRRGCFGH